MKVLVFTHSLHGIGHIKSCQLLVTELSRYFFVDWFVCGLPEVQIPEQKNVRIVSLPKIPWLKPKKISNYSEVLHQKLHEWNTTTASYFEGEYKLLITEAFPITKTGFYHFYIEMICHFRRLNPNAKIYCSSKGRNFLQHMRLERDGDMRYSGQIIRALYDRVFLHSDPSVYRLDEEAQVPSDIEQKYLYYTGYLVNIPTSFPERERLIVVSGGVGMDVDRLYSSALELAAKMPDYTFRFLVGPLAKPLTTSLPNVDITEFIEDFQSLLTRAELAITQAGLTQLDLYACRTPALVYPSKKSPDQTYLSRRFKKRGIVEILSEKELAGDKLFARVQKYLRKKYSPKKMNIKGLENTIAVILDECYR